jgi:hypothetical protein
MLANDVHAAAAQCLQKRVGQCRFGGNIAELDAQGHDGLRDLRADAAASKARGAA